MKTFILTLFSILTILVSVQGYSQTHHFKFETKNKKEINKLTKIISVDNVKGNTVWAYANDKEFEEFSKLDYKIEELPLNDSKGKVINMATTVTEMANWDRYPTYGVYVQMMQDFATNYPDICLLDTIGYSQNGHLVLTLKISDNVNQNEAEPEFFYTSTMHGDETTGFVLMLRLADYLLSNYGTDTEVTDIVNNFEIYINPDANPDGTYYGGDNDVSGSVRSLANGQDPNRDFPDPETGANTPYSQETQDMMDFADAHNFVMSANFHGGAEVYNYPWDAWTSSHPHADDSWYQYIGHAYVDTARLVSSSYMTDVTSSGITEGGDWYEVNGGRQDYMNYYQHCREVTIELSGTKTLSSDLLPAYWNYNKRSLINYIKESHYGFFGTVKNTSGNPLDAKIEISSHDADNSFVTTDPASGGYYRPIAPGTYNVTYSASGYTSQTHTITINDWNSYVIKDVILGGTAGTTNLTGTILDVKTNNPIENAQLSIEGENDSYNLTTDNNGNFSLNGITEGTYKITISKTGYAPQIHFEDICDNNNNLIKKLMPYLNVTGTVTEDGTGNPLENVKIEFLNTNIAPVYTAADGTYTVLEVTENNYNIKASKTGYTAVTKNVDISTSNTVVDFALTVSNAISFESEVPSIFTFGGDADWTRVQDEAYDGDYSMKSGSITDDQTSVMQAELNITSAGDISFYKKVSSESGYDYLKFYIDGTEKGSWSGEVDWSQESYSVTTGTHTFKWEYSKDGSVSNGSDCAWVDYVEFPEYEEPETYTVTFNVTDGTDPLENALVSFNSQNKYTNASGEAVFTDVNQANNMSWSVSKTGYNSQSGTLDITDSDVTKNVILSELETYTVTFNITDGTNPLENALVTFNSQNKYSDADGIAVFNDIEPGNGLPWTVAKTGYTTQNGTVDVTDQDVSINVSINSTDIDIILTISNINISPNPASDFVNISFYTENKTETEIYIYSYNGKLVKTFNLGTLNEGNHKISWNTKNGNNGKKVSSGIYFIKIISGNSYKTAKLILTN